MTAIVMENVLQFVPLGTLRESPLNPRKHFDPVKLQELAESMKRGTGILEPLIVRPLNGRLEIVAGARRYRAAKLAALPEIPILRRDLTDVQALEFMVIENGQRDDLDPIEEAAGYRALIDANPALHSAATIAARIGRSEAYVWDRMKLLDLIPDAKQHLEHSRITAGHAILIARLKPEDQKRVIHPDNGGLFQDQDGFDFEDRPAGEKPGKFDELKAVTVRELAEWIANHIRFDVDHAAKAAPLDFGPTAQAVEAAAAQPGRGKKVIPITHDYNSQSQAASSEDERTYGSTAWKRADGQEKSKTCEHSVLGVVVAGRDYGTSFLVCIKRDKCDVHWKAEMQAREKNAKLRASGQTAKAERASAAAETRRKNEAAAETAIEQQWERAETDLLQACADKVKALKTGAVVAAALKAQDFSAETAKLLPAAKTAEDVLRRQLLEALVDEFGVWKYRREPFAREAKALGVDVAAIVKKHAAQSVQTSGVKAKGKAKA